MSTEARACGRRLVDAGWRAHAWHSGGKRFRATTCLRPGRDLRPGAGPVLEKSLDRVLLIAAERHARAPCYERADLRQLALESLLCLQQLAPL